MLKNIFSIIILFLSFQGNNSFAQFEAKNDSVDKLYERTISIANKLYTEKHYKESVAYYKSALKIKPEKKLAKFRIEDIITIFIKYDIASNREEAEAIIENVEEKIVEETPKETVLYDIPEPIKIDNHIIDTVEKEETKPIVIAEVPEPKVEEPKPVVIIPEKIEEPKPIVEEPIVEKEEIEKPIEAKKPVKVEKIIKAKPVIDQEEANKKMLVKYPDSKTTEQINTKNKKTTKVVINKNNRVTIYLKIEHNWGGVYYFIDNSHLGLDNQSITRRKFFDKTND